MQKTKKIRLIEKTERDNLAFAAAAHDEGREEGRKEGLAEGLEKGLAEGLEKGTEEGEHNAKIATARNLISMGLSVEQISKATSLTVEEIKTL